MLTFRTKLALALGTLGVMLVLILYLLVRTNFEEGFIAYLNGVQEQRVERLITALQRRYPSAADWATLAASEAAWEQALEAVQGEGRRQQSRAPEAPSSRSTASGYLSIALLAPNGQLLQGASRSNEKQAREKWISEQWPKQPVYDTEDRLIGYLARRPITQIGGGVDEVFYAGQQRLFGYGVVFAIGLSLLVAWPLSALLVRPIQRVAGAIEHLIARDYKIRLPGGAKDELGRLSRAMNDLAQTLDQHSETQRAWLADLAHELRTPLCVLQGELEAIDEGVRTADHATLQSLMQQVNRLTRLVEDLKEVLMTEKAALRYQFHALDLAGLLDDELALQQARFARAGLHLTFAGPTQGAVIQGDEQRLLQLFQNLAENSLRYTRSSSDAPGQVRVTLQAQGKHWQVLWEDSAPGVPAAAFSRLFERFYRVDPSRSQTDGGSGLGLAIVANIAQAHGASVRCGPSALGGLKIALLFPHEA